MPHQRTLIFLKPDAYARSLTDEILRRIRRVGAIERMRTLQFTRELIIALWPKFRSQESIERSVAYIATRPLDVYVISGDHVISRVSAVKVELRRRYAPGDYYSLFHASDSVEEADREIALFFL